MGSIDLVDETFIRAEREIVARAVHEPDRWSTWWPDLHLTVFQDRKQQGVRWSITGGLVGSMEVWLEEYRTGVILHHYLRAEPTSAADPSTPRPVGPREATAMLHARARAAKIIFWALKDELEQADG